MQMPNALLKVADVASWLGMKQSTIRKMVCYNRIPHVKLGRMVRFEREAIASKFGLKTDQNLPPISVDERYNSAGR